MQLSTCFHENMPLTSGLAVSIPRPLLFLHLPTQAETAEAWLGVSGVSSFCGWVIALTTVVTLGFQPKESLFSSYSTRTQ